MDIPENIGRALILTTIAGSSTGIGSAIAYFIGIIFIGLIDIFIPEAQKLHHFKAPHDIAEVLKDENPMRSGLLTALAIGIHNFPKGLAALWNTICCNIKKFYDCCFCCAGSEFLTVER
jgi:zinc transporter ZupT